jgi:hypothetical protein
MKIFPLSIPGKVVLMFIAMGFWFIFSLLQWPGWLRDPSLKRHIIWLSVDIFAFMIALFGLMLTAGSSVLWWVLLILVVIVSVRRLVLLRRAVKGGADVIKATR